MVDGANSEATMNEVGCQGEEGIPAVANHHHQLLVEPWPVGQGWFFFFFKVSWSKFLSSGYIFFLNFKYAFTHLFLYINALRIFILTVEKVFVTTTIHFIYVLIYQTSRGL